MNEKNKHPDIVEDDGMESNDKSTKYGYPPWWAYLPSMLISLIAIIIAIVRLLR